eukprot:TRINITY_DN15041_c0_g1_i1.p1 TRINITY_DN15041_c0_g1~~TRINITY_DN15041_c0_g1_i1.p1  ORF type:complete len:95 (-),score=14.41 TRINITY_DN15041_c0_g1_i1:64-348(-)
MPNHRWENYTTFTVFIPSHEKGKLDEVESLELSGPIMAFGTPTGKRRVVEWINEGKLQSSSELYDILRKHGLQQELSAQDDEEKLPMWMTRTHP